MTGYDDELELVLLEGRVTKDLERWRLTIARQCIHEVWLVAAKAGRQSVDKEDSLDQDSPLLLIQQRESRVHGEYIKHLHERLYSLDERLKELE